jgi:hypothetical protein
VVRIHQRAPKSLDKQVISVGWRSTLPTAVCTPYAAQLLQVSRAGRNCVSLARRSGQKRQAYGSGPLSSVWPSKSAAHLATFEHLLASPPNTEVTFDRQHLPFYLGTRRSWSRAPRWWSSPIPLPTRSVDNQQHAGGPASPHVAAPAPYGGLPAVRVDGAFRSGQLSQLAHPYNVTRSFSVPV